MATTNITEVRLLNVPLENDYIHTLYFDDVDSQTEYFLSRQVETGASIADFSYLRKEGFIRYPVIYDKLMGCNYVMYRNADYGDPTKWFYAFITKMEYINDECTFITIETDVIQTWLFDYTFLPSFVEREHVDDDTVGLHTVPEGLETGEYFCNEKIVNTDFSDHVIVVGSTIELNDYENQPEDWNLTKEFKAAYGGVYDNLYSGLKYYIVTPSKLQTLLKHVAYEGQESAIHAMFIAPNNFIRKGINGKHATVIEEATTPVSKSWNCGNKPTTLQDYEPRNKKLLTYPYVYMMVDNGGGGAVTYQYEKFSQAVEFLVASTITPGMSIKAYPKNYNGVFHNKAEGINLAKFATCSWTTDAYTSWLSQNAINVGISATTGIASAAIGVASALAAPATAGASLAAAGAIVGGVGAVGGQVASVYQHSQVPPQVHGNTNTGDVSTANGDITFTAYKMTVKKEYAQIIDSFFDLYGYKVNRLKVPNKNHRKSYWYTKTIDANITKTIGASIKGALPLEDMQKIKECYNKGITFWKNTASIGNYSLSNEII